MKYTIASVAAFFLSVISFSVSAKADSEILCAGSLSGTVPCYGGVTVPAYLNSIGCAPTSIGMLLAYWDLRYGYNNMFVAQGGIPSLSDTGTSTGLYQTSNVSNEISSIAGYCKTDINGNTTTTNALNGIKNYAAFKGYGMQATYTNFSLSTGWQLLVSEINAGRPMLFVVDSSGDGVADHMICTFGYDTNHDGDGLYYACYTTDNEGETPYWYKFQTTSSSYKYGILQEIKVVPEPATWGLFLIGTILVLLTSQRRRLKVHSL